MYTYFVSHVSRPDKVYLTVYGAEVRFYSIYRHVYNTSHKPSGPDAPRVTLGRIPVSTCTLWPVASGAKNALRVHAAHYAHNIRSAVGKSSSANWLRSSIGIRRMMPFLVRVGGRCGDLGFGLALGFGFAMRFGVG